MNYLVNQTAKYSFNGKGECFLSLKDNEDEFKIENCYGHEMQENLFYQIISKDIANINFTALYGITKYQEFKKSEFDLWAGYELVKDLNLNLGYTVTKEDKKDPNSTNLQQFNATIAYVF